MDFTDAKKIGNTNWGELKNQAFDEKYKEKEWYTALTAEDKEVLEKLKGAQKE